MINVVLADWMGYPLYRRKKIKNRVIECGVGRLLEMMKRFEAGKHFECTLIINTDQQRPSQPSILPRLQLRKQKSNCAQSYQHLLEKYPFIKKILFRENIGMDIGSYNCGLNYLRRQNFDGDVLFMNSSVTGPNSDHWLRKYHDFFHQDQNVGLVGISLNSQNTCVADRPFRPHVQSFFLYSSMPILNEAFPLGLTGRKIDATRQKDELVIEGEIRLSEKILALGYSIGSYAFPDFIYKIGAEWRIPHGDLRFTKQFRHLANKI